MHLDTKIKYVFKHRASGHFKTEIFTLEEVERYTMKMGEPIAHFMSEEGYDCVDRRLSLGLFDANGVELFEGDVVRYWNNQIRNKQTGEVKPDWKVFSIAQISDMYGCGWCGGSTTEFLEEDFSSLKGEK